MIYMKKLSDWMPAFAGMTLVINRFTRIINVVMPAKAGKILLNRCTQIINVVMPAKAGKILLNRCTQIINVVMPAKAGIQSNSAAGLLLSVLLTSVGLTQAAETGTLTVKQSELKQVTARINAVQQAIVSGTQQRGQLENNLKKAEVAIGQLKPQVKHTNRSLQQKRQTLVGLAEQQRQIEATLKMQRAQLAKQMRSIYQLAQLHPLKIVLNQDSPATLSKTLTYYRYLNKAHTKSIEDIQVSLATLAENRKQISANEQQLTNLLQQLKDQQAQLHEEHQQRQTIIQSLDQQLKTHKERLAELQANKSRLESVITNLTKQQTHWSVNFPKSGGKFGGMRGRLRWPTPGKIGPKPGMHGVFIAGAAGADVHAVYDGQVIFSDWLKGFGLLLILDHGGGYMSLYAHNQSLQRKVGDVVKSGDVIADIGRSGGIADNGLYFEIRHNGKPINPVGWCG
jgi:septal ring factor EnvC (AmiA/AmiB activator)